MEYIKIRFGGDIGRLDSGMERTLDSIFRSLNPLFADCEQAWTPQLDIEETPQAIIVTAEIAGVLTEDLAVEINNRAVRIRGQRRPQPSEGGTFRLAEIQYGAFERTIQLPTTIDAETVEATYNGGLLCLRMKKSHLETPRRIPISDE
jgi:HSP20 family protein